jgi:hypothetical protein
MLAARMRRPGIRWHIECRNIREPINPLLRRSDGEEPHSALHRNRLRSSQPLTPEALDTSGVSIGEDCKTNLSRSPVILQSGVCPRVGEAASSGDVLRRPA